MDFTEYALLSLTIDGEEVPTLRWDSVHLPDSPAAGSLVVPTSVCNNPRVMILAVDEDVWTTEDSGIRTMEFCVDDAERALTDTAMAALSGEIVVKRDGDKATITNGSYRLDLLLASADPTRVETV